MSAAPEQAFAPSYAQARELFLQAAHDRGLAVDTRPHPLPGRDGEAMAMDVVWDGPARVSRVLIVSSACHGCAGENIAETRTGMVRSRCQHCRGRSGTTKINHKSS